MTANQSFEKIDLDNSPSDDVDYERRGGNVRTTKELENKKGLDVLLVKPDIENENDESSGDSMRKKVSVKTD